MGLKKKFAEKKFAEKKNLQIPAFRERTIATHPSDNYTPMTTRYALLPGQSITKTVRAVVLHLTRHRYNLAERQKEPGN